MIWGFPTLRVMAWYDDLGRRSETMPPGLSGKISSNTSPLLQHYSDYTTL